MLLPQGEFDLRKYSNQGIDRGSKYLHSAVLIALNAVDLLSIFAILSHDKMWVGDSRFFKASKAQVVDNTSPVGHHQLKRLERVQYLLLIAGHEYIF